MEILDNTTMPDFVHFHKKVLVLLFEVRNFKVSVNKSECLKVKYLIKIWIQCIPDFIQRHLLIGQA